MRERTQRTWNLIDHLLDCSHCLVMPCQEGRGQIAEAHRAGRALRTDLDAGRDPDTAAWRRACAALEALVGHLESCPLCIFSPCSRWRVMRATSGIPAPPPPADAARGRAAR
jgi:hypothetical protein